LTKQEGIDSSDAPTVPHSDLWPVRSWNDNNRHSALQHPRVTFAPVAEKNERGHRILPSESSIEGLPPHEIASPTETFEYCEAVVSRSGYG